MGSSVSAFNKKVLDVVTETLGNHQKPEWANEDSFTTNDALDKAMLDAGLESSNLIIGIDFTKSNDFKPTCKHSFEGRPLHSLGVAGGNPYEQVIQIMGSTLAQYDDDGKIVAVGFGDTASRHETVTHVGPKNGCDGFEGVLTEYKRTLQTDGFHLSGPTSFAPVINHAVNIVRESGNQYHILLMIGDGAVSKEMDCKKATVDAIIAASHVPLSIVMVGVGDGPWDEMQKFDDELPQRKFDNFQFVDFTKFSTLMRGASEKDKKIAACAFKMCALMEIPAQYRAIRELKMLGNVAAGAAASVGEKRGRDEAAAISGEPARSRARVI